LYLAKCGWFLELLIYGQIGAGVSSTALRPAPIWP